jgi:type II secretory pathway pseudopilin PulG
MTSLGRGFVGGIVAVLLSGTATAVFAQSLADVAKKEEERRKAVKEAGKTYTNSDLKTVPPATAGAATAPPEASKPAAADADKDKKDTPKEKDAAKDKDHWAGRMKELRTQLDRDQTYADALQSRINQLTADFVGRDDPAQRGTIGRDKQKAIDELNRLKQQIVDDKKAISDLEDEAHRAGVPPGWLRS